MRDRLRVVGVVRSVGVFCVCVCVAHVLLVLVFRLRSFSELVVTSRREFVVGLCREGEGGMGSVGGERPR